MTTTAKPPRLMARRGADSEQFRLDRTCLDRLSKIAAHHEEAMGRKVSRSILVRRAIELMFDRVEKAVAAGSMDSEVAALARHLRA